MSNHPLHPFITQAVQQPPQYPFITQAVQQPPQHQLIPQGVQPINQQLIHVAQPAQSNSVNNANNQQAQLNQTTPATPANTSSRNRPLTDELRLTPIPRGFKGPTNVPSYTGDSDPYEWVQKFEAAMTLHGETDLLMCRTFPTLLGSRALDWYAKLPNGCISTWDDLASKFKNQFSSSRPAPKSVHVLENVRQQQGESLRSYFDRFDREAVSITGLDPKVQVHILLRGLRSGPFAYELARHEVTNIDDVKQRAQGFMRIEEYKDSRGETKTTTGRDEKKPSSTNEKKNKNDRRGGGNYDKWTGGNRKSPARDDRKPQHVRRHVDEPYVPQPPVHGRREVMQADVRDNPPPRWPRDDALYCNFHKRSGHSTETCWGLKK